MLPTQEGAHCVNSASYPRLCAYWAHLALSHFFPQFHVFQLCGWTMIYLTSPTTNRHSVYCQSIGNADLNIHALKTCGYYYRRYSLRWSLCGLKRNFSRGMTWMARGFRAVRLAAVWRMENQEQQSEVRLARSLLTSSGGWQWELLRAPIKTGRRQMGKIMNIRTPTRKGSRDVRVPRPFVSF